VAAEWETEPGIRVAVSGISNTAPASATSRILLGIAGADPAAVPAEYLRSLSKPGDAVYLCEPRGIGTTRWTEKNPPNYVTRSHVLLGQTVDTGRVWDVIAVARGLRERHNGKAEVVVVGEGASGVLAAYGALWEPEIAGVILGKPPLSHMDPAAPQFLNVLRVCDVPEVLGMLAPRSLGITAVNTAALARTTAIYAAAGSVEKLKVSTK
jgi:hypothetical protein